MEEVSQLLERIEDASTEPFEGKIKDKRVYIKPFGSRWSNRILINEYICLNLARKLQLPIPNGGYCRISDETDTSSVDEYIDYDETITGIAFYSEKIYNMAPNIKSISIVKNIINKEDINAIILFDHLIYNIDRHKGNLLLNYGLGNDGIVMYIIDHSHVFNLYHNWDSYGLQCLIDGNDYKDTRILDDNYTHTYKYFYELGIVNKTFLVEAGNKFKSIITEELLNNIIDMIPKVWIINLEDMEKLKQYILYRVQNIDYMIDMIVNYK